MTRFVVYGAGAVGGTVAARLADAGHDVSVIARGAHGRAIATPGLVLETPDGARTVRPQVADAPAELGLRPGDVVLLGMKSQHTAEAVAALSAVAPSDIAVVCLQNGVANERVALRRFRSVYAVPVMLPATHLVPGVVEAYSTPTTGILDIGRYPTGIDDRAREIADAFSSATFESVPRDDIQRWKWRKLLLNLGNAIEALCGEPSARLYGLAHDEGEAALTAAGVAFASTDEDRERRGDLLRMRPIEGKRRGGGSSWQSLVRGTGSIETDYLNGEVVLLGRLHGVPTPVNEALQRLANAAARAGARPGSCTEDDVLAEAERLG